MELIETLTPKLVRHFKDKQNRSYPLLLTKEQIGRELNHLVKGEQTGNFLDERDGDITGFLGYAVDPEGKYIQTQIVASFNRDVSFILQSLDRLIDRYPDYTLDVGVEADNELVVDAVKQKSFSLLDDTYAMSVHPRRGLGRIHPEIVQVTAAAWEDYRDLHERAFQDYYWTHAKIGKDFANWIVYSMKDGKQILAYTFIGCNPTTRAAEIMGIYGYALNDRIVLIEHAVGILREMKILYYFTEDPDEMKSCQKLGFELHGHYQLWTRAPGPNQISSKAT